MKRIFGFIIGTLLALFLTVNLDRVSHPREFMGTWKSSTGVVIYTFENYGTGKSSNNKGESYSDFTWYRIGDKILIERDGSLDNAINIQNESSKIILYHPGYKDKYNKLRKSEDDSSKKNFYDVFEGLCDFLMIKLPKLG